MSQPGQGQLQIPIDSEGVEHVAWASLIFH